MASFCSFFDVVRINIAAVDNDQVFQATGYEQFAVLHEAQISRAEERTVVGIAQISMESVRGFFIAVPITLSDGRPCDPNLANYI